MPPSGRFAYEERTTPLLSRFPSQESLKWTTVSSSASPKPNKPSISRAEIRISRNIYYALFIFKRRSHFLYRKDRGVGKKNPGPFSKRIMGYWFRGNWFTGAYPIKGALGFRESLNILSKLSRRFDAMKLKELKSECRFLGLKVSGTKAVLRERLRSHYNLTYNLTYDTDQAGSSRKRPTKTTTVGGGGVKRRK